MGEIANTKGGVNTAEQQKVIVQVLSYGLIPESIYVFTDEDLAKQNLEILIKKHNLTHEPDQKHFYKSDDEESELHIDDDVVTNQLESED